MLLLVQCGCSIAICHQQVTSVCDMMSVVRGFDWVLCMIISVRVRGKECWTFWELMSTSVTAPGQ
jgi:hypothetical protein